MKHGHYGFAANQGGRIELLWTYKDQEDKRCQRFVGTLFGSFAEAESATADLNCQPMIAPPDGFEPSTSDRIDSFAKLFSLLDSRPEPGDDPDECPWCGAEETGGEFCDDHCRRNAEP